MNVSLSRWFRPAFPRCLICGKDAGSSQNRKAPPVRHPEALSVLRRLCSSCSETIPWIGSPVCRVCGRPEACPDCPRRAERHVAFSRSAVRYDNRMRELLALYKYRGSEGLEPLMAAMLAYAYERIVRELAGRGRAPLIDAVTSVPLARERLEERGFNQAEWMARILADWYGISYLTLLQRNRHTEKQSLKNRQSRLADMRGNFTASDPEKLRTLAARYHQPLRILLVDDIYTTGSTVNECAGALQSAFTTLAPANAPLIRSTIYGLLWARS